MNTRMDTRRTGRWLALGLALPALGYAATVAMAWARYGRPAPPKPAEADALLDRFMPSYEVAERHHVRVEASSHITFTTAGQLDLQQSRIVRAIFRTREIVLGAEGAKDARPKGLLADMKSLGWAVLAEEPGHAIVLGAVTQPWLANVVFRGLEPSAFAAFSEPGYVKIAWTLRADPIGDCESVFRTETRVMTTDPVARRKFRWYWARFSPGIVLIRHLMLALLKTGAEQRAKEISHGYVLDHRRGHRLQRDVA